jgi:hypothetical protein
MEPGTYKDRQRVERIMEGRVFLFFVFLKKKGLQS